MNLNVMYTRKVLCLSKKEYMAVCSHVVNNGLDCSWSLYIGPLWPTKYWKNTTTWLQMAQIGHHKTAETT